MNLLLLFLFIIIIKFVYYYYYNYKYANLIIPNLWLGSRVSSLDKEFIQRNNIQLIINCTKNLPFIDLLYLNKYRLEVHDNFSKETHDRILEKISEINELIDYYLKNNKGVLIHCHAGMQRAATVTACYLMYKYLYNVDNVIKFIKKKRKIAFRPRVNYYNVLLEFKTKL
tara:strand:+ start:73 stop:582 length:510 start_codon:yes stop_codon:yes gene_type:complete